MTNRNQIPKEESFWSKAVAPTAKILIGGSVIGLIIAVTSLISDSHGAETENEVTVAFVGIATACWDIESIQKIIKAETEGGKKSLHAKFRELFPEKCGFYPGFLGKLKQKEFIRSINPNISISAMEIPFSGKRIYFTFYNTSRGVPANQEKELETEACYDCI